MHDHGAVNQIAPQRAQTSAVKGKKFDPMAMAREMVMRRVARGPVHYGLVVECVRLSSVARLVSGYDVFQGLLMESRLQIDGDGILSVPRHVF